MTMKKIFAIPVVGFALTLAAGCSDRTEQKAQEAKQESGEAAEKTGEMIESAAKDAVQNTKEAGANAAAATENAAEKVGEAAKDATQAVGAAVQTADVKTALLADARVDASHIDVDTDHNTKVVTLRGSVPVAGQKAIAESIAAANAKGYRIDNQLRVGG